MTEGPSAQQRPDFADLSDPDLSRLSLLGDTGAWREIVRRYRGLVYSVPLRLGLRAEDADDVFQETFLALVEKLSLVRDRERLAAWLAVTARRKALDRVCRGAAVHEVAMPPFFEVVAPHDLPLEDLLRLERQNDLRLALAALPERCGSLIRMLFYEEPTPSYEDVARRLELPRGSLGPTRRRCFEKLRQSVLQLREGGGIQQGSTCVSIRSMKTRTRTREGS